MSDMVLNVLFDSSVRVAVVATFVATALVLFRVRDSTTRHAAWTIVLVAMLLMPALSRLVPNVGVPLPAAARGIVTVPAMPSPTPRIGGSSQPLGSPLTVPARRTALANISVEPAPAESSRQEERSWAAVALGAYLAGAVVMLLRFGVGLWAAQWLALGGRPVGASTDRRLRAVPVAIRESCRVTVPVTVGFFKTTIVLPSGWRRWSDSTLLAVLAHEEAHAARRDPLVAGLASLNLCLSWFHPLAWWLRRTLVLTAEQVCDEAALRTVGAPRAYIDVLRSMALAVRKRGGRYLWEGVGINGSPLLARRIAHIRRIGRRRAASPSSRFAMVACCCLIAIAVATCRPVDELAEGTRPETEPLIERTSASWPVDSLIDLYPDTEVAVAQRDRPRAEEILLQRRTEDPTGLWSARLGRFYAASIVGYYVRITDEGPLREMTDLDPDSSFAAHARTRLAESSDPVLLAAAGEYMLHAPRFRPGYSSQDDVLAKDCLERAARLDAASVRTRTMLAAVVSRERWLATLALLRGVGPVAQYEALAALPAAERFETMAQAAVDALVAVRGAARTNDRNMARYVEVKADNARRFAQEVLALSPSLPDMSDAGLFVYRAHMTLASLEMLDGDTDGAVESLRQASLAPSAEGLAYGRGVAAWRVVRQLVEAGEQAAVVDFLRAMAEKSAVDRDLLLAAAEDVSSGQPPARLFERV